MDSEIVSRLREAAPHAFGGEPVLFAYLFGSRAAGPAHRDSDVDVAVRVGDGTPRESHLDLRLRLAGRLEDASGVGDIEVVVINDLPLPVRGRAVRDRVVIYSRDEPARVRFESRTLDDFLDFEIRGRPLDRELLRAIAEGRR